MKINEVLISELRLRKTKHNTTKQMASWTPKKITDLAKLTSSFPNRFEQLWGFFSIDSQVWLEQYFVITWDLGTNKVPHAPLKFTPIFRDTNSQQIPSLGLEWGVEGTVIKNSTKTQSKGITIMQLQMVVAMLKYKPRDARSYFSVEATNQNV